MVQTIWKYDVKEALGFLEYRVDEEERAHITVDVEKCRDCNHMMCVWGCPAQCYMFRESGFEDMVFRFEDCVECGTCFIMCDQGALSWNHPRGAFGITYKYG